MLDGIALDLAGGCLQHFDLQALGEPKDVDGANHTGLGRLYGILLIMDRGRAAGQVEDLIHLYKKGMGDVVTQKLAALVVQEVVNMVPCSGEEIVHTEHLASTLQQTFT
jgi:hypothetical protein